jgi:hypothetical protein
MGLPWFFRAVTILIGLSGVLPAAAEVFKCTEDGKTVFQDRPCRSSGTAVKVQPANGSMPNAPASSPQDDLARTKSDINGMALERRRREIAYEIEKLESDIRGFERSRDAELRALRARKIAANNNLAGATWEQSISTEMQAVTEKYKTNIEGARSEIGQLRQQLTEMSRQQVSAAK